MSQEDPDVHDTWRGWFAYERTTPLSAFGGGDGEWVFREFHVDTDPHGQDAVWKGDIYFRSEDVFADGRRCQKSESAGSESTLVETRVSSLDNDQVNDHDLPVPTGMLGWRNAFDGFIIIDMPGVQLFCDDDQVYPGGADGGPLAMWATIPWPAEEFSTPPLTAAREYRFSQDASNQGHAFDVVVCMTRETTDSDGDGLPDVVDLDPARAASALELGIPGGPPDTPIPPQFGGPAGVRGLPHCPAVDPADRLPDHDDWAPVVMLHPEEPWGPAEPADFISGSTLGFRITNTVGRVEADVGQIDPQRLGFNADEPYGITYGDGCVVAADDLSRPHGHTALSPACMQRDDGWFLDFQGDPASISRPTTGRAGPTVHYERGEGSITYWLFYPYSRPSGAGAGGDGGLPPFGEHTSFAHEGDWERVAVLLDDQANPTAMRYFMHQWYIDVPWEEVGKDDVTGRPLVFAARNGHGSYPTPDCYVNVSASDPIHHTLDTCSADGPRWDTSIRLADATAQPWYGFGGAWGRVGLSADTTGPVGPGHNYAAAGTSEPVEIVGGAPLIDVPVDGTKDRIAQTIQLAQWRFAGPGQAARGVAADRHARHVVLARADEFADALTGTSLTGHGPLLYTDQSGLRADVADAIAALLPPGASVYLLGGEAALSSAVEQAVADLGFQPIRLAGPTRFHTAAAIADEAVRLYPREQTVAMIARAVGTDENPTAAWADSVTTGVVAAMTGVPILLTDTMALDQPTDDWLDQQAVSTTVVLGGTAAISDPVAQALPGAARVAGADRAGTAAAVATQLLGLSSDTHRRTVLVDGWATDGWQTGLAAAGIAADLQAALLPAQQPLADSLVPLLAGCPPERTSSFVLLTGDGPDSGLHAELQALTTSTC